MALKVVSSRPSTTGLKVVRSTSGLGTSTYNPQRTVSPQVTYNPQRATYNPQKTYNPQQAAKAAQVAAVTQAQFRAAALAQQQAADRARIAAETAKRNAQQAKATEINNRKQGFLGKLADKVTFGQTRRERAGREKAAKYYKENEVEWGALIMAKQRNYETEGARLKNWVIQSNSEAEYNQRIAAANKWLDTQYKTINKDIQNFTASQKGLSIYGAKPLSGKLSTGARVFKKAVTSVAGTAFNTLAWTASQPQRAVNTAKNFVNPNNLRQYYGGKEVKNGKDIVGKGSNPFSQSVDQLRKSYNASRNQRTVGFSKADESARLKGWSGKVKVDGKDRFVTKTPSGIDRFRIKYGDDIADMALDPMNFFAGAGSATKVGKTSSLNKLYQFAGKNPKLKNIALNAEVAKIKLGQSKVGRAASWLNKPSLPRNAAASEKNKGLHDQLLAQAQAFKTEKSKVYDSFKDSFKQNNKTKSDFLTAQAQQMQALEARKASFKVRAERLADDFVKRAGTFSNREARAISKFARNGKWSAWDNVNISKARKKELQGFLTDYQERAGAMAKSEGLTNKAKTYLPEYTGRGYDPTKSRTLFGDKYYGQSTQQLQESLVMREFASNWDESNQHIQEIAAIEKSMLRNAGKTNRALTASETKKLSLLRARKKELQKLSNRYKTDIDAIRDEMGAIRQGAKPAIKIGKRGIQTNFTKQGFKNTAVDIAKSPMTIWNRAVLKYNPAWYVNNLGTNIPHSISAAGGGVLKEHAKLALSRKYRQSSRADLPEGVLGNISNEIGGSGGIASGLENWSRQATFNTLKKKGFTDDQAIKQTNRWLFDYTTRRWERPIKGVLPFWQWQKNLLRLGTTMPFHSPRSAKAYSETYKAAIQRPYEALPDQEQSYIDPDTGKKVTYSPKEFYKGKAKLGDNWYGVPFFAMNPESMTNFGVNPYMMAGADYMTTSDRLGNPNNDRSGLSILGERFPQFKLGAAFIKRKIKDSRLWFAESGSSKEKQGYDRNASSYDKNLDNQLKFKNAAKTFVGIPRGVKFDKKEFDTKFRLTKFNTDFFKVDWDKRLVALQEETGDQYFGFDDPRSPFNRLRQEQEALAKKYGFDLQKDIYDKYWSKYDTATTRNTKQLKKSAYEFSRNFWRDYLSKPAGSKTSASQRRPFLIGKYDEWRRNNTFADNVYKKIPEFSVYDKQGNKTNVKATKNPFTLKSEQASSEARRAAGAAKYAKKLAYDKAKKTGDWSAFNKKYGNSRKSSPFTADGKYFKTAASRQKYLAGKAKYDAGKARYAAGKAKTDLWTQYYKLNTTAERKAFLAKHPQLATYKTPTTQAEWDALRVTIRQKNRAKIAKLSNFTTAHANAKADIAKRVQGFQPFGKTKRIRYKA